MLRYNAATEPLHTDEASVEHVDCDASVAEMRAKAESAWKEVFFLGLRACTASEEPARSHARSAGEPRWPFSLTSECTVEHVLGREFPEVTHDAVAMAWTTFKAMATSIPRCTSRLSSRMRVHPVLDALVECAMGVDCRLKCWYDRKPLGTFPTGVAHPVFPFTACDDVSLATLATQVLLEVNAEHNYESAMTSASAHARRTEVALLEEADARGDRNLDALCTYAIGSDVRFIGFVRVSSGAPRHGAPHKGCCPCPTHESCCLPLLDDAYTVNNTECLLDTTKLPDAAPAGFAVLVRVLRAGAYLVAQRPPLPVCGSFTFGRRLGSGGISDVYEMLGNTTACVKVPRYTSVGIVASYANEVDALTALRSHACVHIPVLRFVGERAAATSSVAWPFIAISPTGVPLAVAANALCATDRELEDVRRTMALLVARGLASALRCAHAAGRIHCDVSPRNVVIVGAAPRAYALLVDWALSAPFGDDVAGTGQELYMADAVLTCGVCAAGAWVDLVGAAYTLLAIAFGSPPLWRAPWCNAHQRNEWCYAHIDDTRVARVVNFIAAVGEHADIPDPCGALVCIFE